MPITPTYPGVYIQEVPSSNHVIAGVPTSIAAFIGGFAQGTRNLPQQCFSMSDVEGYFGDNVSNKTSEAYYALQQFFLNGGSQAWIVNVAGGSTTTQSLQLYQNGTQASNYALKLAASSPGAWGNNLQVIIDYNTPTPDQSFNMTIQQMKMVKGALQPAKQEYFQQLTLDPHSPSYAGTVINSRSKLLRIDLANSTLPSTGVAQYRPAQSGTVLNGASLNVSQLSNPSLISAIGHDGSTIASGQYGINTKDIVELAYNALVTTGLLASKIQAIPGFENVSFSLANGAITLKAGGGTAPTLSSANMDGTANSFLTAASGTLSGDVIDLNFPNFGSSHTITITSGDGKTSGSFILGASDLDTLTNVVLTNLSALLEARLRTLNSLHAVKVQKAGKNLQILSGNSAIALVNIATPNVATASSGNANNKLKAPAPATPAFVTVNYQQYGGPQAVLATQSLAAKSTSSQATLTADSFKSLAPASADDANNPMQPASIVKALTNASVLNDKGVLNTDKLPQSADSFTLKGYTPEQAAQIHGVLAASAPKPASPISQNFAMAQSNILLGTSGSAPTAVQLLGDQASKTGIYALENVDIFNILSIPDTRLLSQTDAAGLMPAAQTYCQNRRAFYVIDAPSGITSSQTVNTWASSANLRFNNVAVYYPTHQIADPANNFALRTISNSGAIAGLYATTDVNRGVWKSPAGTTAVLKGAAQLTDTLSDGDVGNLTGNGLNAVRSSSTYGIISWGARTLLGTSTTVGSDAYSYVAPRRTAYFIEESLKRGTQWVVFEPNGEQLWAQIRLSITSFMQGLYQQGAFQGATPKDAYFVACDATTTTQADIDQGIVNIVVGFAPLKPAEFVIISFEQNTQQGS